MARSLGEKITKAVTKNQMIDLLDSFFQILDPQQLQRLLASLDEDLRATLSQLMQSKTALEATILSHEKLIEEWKSLWGEWYQFTSEVGDDEGRYAIQDNDWDPPYFDSDQLAFDLEPVAERMLPLLEQIHRLEVEPDDLFERALKSIEAAIKRYPEWMGADCGDPCVLEFAVTSCVLKWQWLIAETAGDFLLGVVRLEESLRHVELGRGGFVEFFAGLPEEARAVIYSYLNKNQDNAAWQSRLQNVGSRWHEIYHALQRTFDHDGYIRESRELLHKKWDYGLPLLEHLLSKKEFSDAERVANQMVDSFLRLEKGDEWKPESSLLIARSSYPSRYGHGSSLKGIARVLRHWLVAAEKLNMAERAAALKFQLVTAENPYDWDVVLACYQELKGSPFSKTTERLLHQWIDHTSNIYSGFRSDKVEKTRRSWVADLLECIFDSSKDDAWFREQTRQWLQAIYQGSANHFRDQKMLLALLTCDLDKLYGIGKDCPRLIGAICWGCYEDEKLTRSRQTWLQRMHADRLIGPLMKCWKKCAVHLVPDPSNVSRSDYTTHASQLGVLYELNPREYQALIRNWQVKHKRRTNLWKAVRAIGLPTSEGKKAG